MSDRFRHLDGQQTIVFGPDALDEAADLIGEGYTLLSTARAVSAAPALADRAAAAVQVPAGPVDEIAAQLRDQVGTARLVALGGGRVIDTAKALAAASGLPGPVAIPTSLSGAEMTGVHRHARGVLDDTPRSRASLVVNDPALSASQPVEQLAASSANALGHAITALLSTCSTPIARAVARDAIERLTQAWSGQDPDREQLALASLLAGWAVDRSGLGPHHALAQTVVRLGCLPHADVNAALLPHTVRALRERAPVPLARLDEALGTSLEDTAEKLRDRASVSGLEALTADHDLLDRAVGRAAQRAELDRVPPAMTAPEIRHIYVSAA